VPYSLLRSATEKTLSSLIQGNFITPAKTDEGPSSSAAPLTGGAPSSSGSRQKQGGIKYFQATEKGTAVYRSGLPTSQGVELYKRWVEYGD